MTPEEIKKNFFIKNTTAKIKVAENGKQAVFLNPDRNTYFVIQVDGVLIQNAVACDYVVSKEKLGDLVIELKGCDVNHAVDQIQSTAKYWEEKKLREGKIAALIVCSKYPRFDTKIAKFATAFAKQYKGPLHVVTKNQEYQIERVLDFSGPF
jgi:hypothetical protein